jgi:prophage regulatory protein
MDDFPHSIQGYLRLPEVLRLFPVSKSTWWAGIKAGKYPPGIKLSARVTAWRRADILALIASA